MTSQCQPLILDDIGVTNFKGTHSKESFEMLGPLKGPNIQTQGHVSKRSYFDILHFF